MNTAKLKAAATACEQQEPLTLVVYHGKMFLRNTGGIVFTVLRDSASPEYSAENENYAHLAESATPANILALLAERDADKKRIAELEKRVAELEANQITATGTQFLSEAIGAHAYIAGCLVQGRPDLALEEAHKWVSVFSEVAAGINLETGGEA